MRIKHLSLVNFRGFAALELEFDPRLTVLVGANGSGKSSVLEAIAFVLRSVVDSEWDVGPACAASLRHRASSGSVAVRTDLVLPEPLTRFSEMRLEIGHHGATFAGVRGSLIAKPDGTVPAFVYFAVDRSATDRTPGSTSPKLWSPPHAWQNALDARASYEALFSWFREREDLENEARVQDGAGTDARLDAVRTAIERAMPGFTHPRVRRPRETAEEHEALRKPTLVVDKAGEMFAFNQLSEGERSLLAMVADIARRLAIANVGSDPLSGAGVVMIDEIELHLHPKWQAEVLDRLLAVFPNLQFIVTTHSPLVLADVKAEQIRLLEGFKVYAPAHPVQGRDAGSILSEVFHTNPLPDETRDVVERISGLIDADRFDEARTELAALESKLGDLDVEVVRLRTAIELMAS